ncbi:MAG: hypothetical protein ACLTNO_04045 [Blautia sp.]
MTVTLKVGRWQDFRVCVNQEISERQEQLNMELTSCCSLTDQGVGSHSGAGKLHPKVTGQ